MNGSRIIESLVQAIHSIAKSAEYEFSEEQQACVDRAIKVWEDYKGPELGLTPAQECVVRNMLFRMQGTEHRHFGIEIKRGKIISEENTRTIKEPTEKNDST